MVIKTCVHIEKGSEQFTCDTDAVTARQVALIALLLLSLKERTLVSRGSQFISKIWSHLKHDRCDQRVFNNLQNTQSTK